jgi:hypothetical protein
MKGRFNKHFSGKYQSRIHDKMNDVAESYLLVIGFSAVHVGCTVNEPCRVVDQHIPQCVGTPKTHCE